MRILLVLSGILLILALVAYVGGSLLGQLTGAADANSRIEIARVQAEAQAAAQVAQAQAQAQVSVAQANATGAAAWAMSFGLAFPIIALIVVGGLIVLAALVLTRQPAG